MTEPVPDMFLAVTKKMAVDDSIPGITYSETLELKESNIHGLGVFTKVNIPKDEIVTVYPAHMVRIKDQLIGYGDVVNQYNTPELQKEILKYAYNVSAAQQIMGDPKQISKKHLLGHMVNDGYKVPSQYGIAPMDVVKDITKYVICDNIYNNCKYSKMGPSVVIKTVRDVMAGDELLVPYGFNYWSAMSDAKISLALQKSIPSISNRAREMLHQYGVKHHLTM